MPQNSDNLNKLNSETSYLTLTVIFILLSLLGGFLYFQLSQKNSSLVAHVPTPTPASNVEDSESNLYPSIPSRPETDIISTAPTSVTKASATSTLVASPTEVPATPMPTPIILTFNTQEDAFSITYRSDRKIYTDQEFSGNRYTFYRNDGNIVVHVGSKWSWTYPNRQFTPDLTVSGKSTFRYDTSSQTIIDLQNNGLNYTIQCIHNGKPSLKSECDQFLKDFKLL